MEEKKVYPNWQIFIRPSGSITLYVLPVISIRPSSWKCFSVRITLSVDMPDIDPILIQTMDPEGPYGAKEGGLTISMSAYKAIANAFYDATGVWLKKFPYTPDKVLKALEDKKKNK